tara:strand:- start:185 stop:553 length:369 start_codon:yes stop_codon:yes gene_type:complete
MNKTELNQEIEKLKVSLEAHEEQVKDLSHDLKIATQKLEDCDKPKLTEKQLNAVCAAIENSVDNFTFDDSDSYETEFGIEYDGRVYLESIIFDGQSTLSEHIYQDVESLFGLADEVDTDSDS